MKNFEPLDDETGIEQYPGYVGMIWDKLPSDLACLAEFDWLDYVDLISQASVARVISYTFRNQRFLVEYNPGEGVESLIDQLQTVEVHFDPGPPNGGPASGHGFIFFARDGVEVATAISEIEGLMSAMQDDLHQLRSAETR